jgi:hypothetical protein
VSRKPGPLQKASIIRTKADVPSKPNTGKVQFFLDIEGGGALQTDQPEPAFSSGS